MPLQPLLKARFDTALKCIPPGQWKILIVDDHSRELLTSVYKEFDVLQQNVTAIEPLHSPRPPQSLDAIYLLTPTSQNVDRIIADFSGRRTYNSAYLYFIDGVDDSLANKLTSQLPPDVLRAFVELYCDFWPVESQVFSTRTPSSLYTLFGSPGGQVASELAVEAFEDDIKLIGRTVLNVMATLGENPTIRYYQPYHHPPLGALSLQQPAAAPVQQAQASSQSLRWRSALGGGGAKQPEYSGDYLSKRLATQIQDDLDEYMAANPDFPPTANPPRPKAILFVVDRSMDPVAPFLHEFTYQAMVNDLLKVEDGTHYHYKYKNTVGMMEEKEAILSEEDTVWTSVRHLHMKEAIDTLMQDFQRFAQEHAGFRGGQGSVNINDMKDMLASLPQFQEQRDKFSLHLDMAHECMALFEQKKLPQTANVEQCCATNTTAEGKSPKTLVEEMVPLLDDRAVSSTDKVRIIALYILHRDGVPDEDRRRLFQHARLSLSEQESVNNLVHLGAKVVKAPNERTSKTRLKMKPTGVEEEYELSRYRPVIRSILEDHHNNKLDQTNFPYVRDAPMEAGSTRGGAAPPPTTSLRSARPTWHKAPSARLNNTEGKQRMILFVAGGITYSEMRLAYTIGRTLGKEVIIGSTHVTTPDGFVKDLKSIGRGGIGGNPPNAPPLHPGAPARPPRAPGKATSYQYILDRRYWVDPVGPPPLAPPPSLAPPPIQSKPSGTSSLSSRMSDMSLGSTKDSKKDKKDKKDKEEGGKKKGLFKMRWD